jgi:diguanylate cyclase (GGDEF)-like protein
MVRDPVRAVTGNSDSSRAVGSEGARRKRLRWLGARRSHGGTDVGSLLRQIEVLREEVRGLTLLARTDPLTGLANRRGWDEQLTRELARAQRSETEMSVALLDLDDFKNFNDAKGHQAGDRLLVEAAAAWRAQLRDIDVLCRWGGDEFAVLLPGCSEREAQEVIARLGPATPNGQSCAAGVAAWDGHETSHHLLRRADTALLNEKQVRRYSRGQATVHSSATG